MAEREASLAVVGAGQHGDGHSKLLAAESLLDQGHVALAHLAKARESQEQPLGRSKGLRVEGLRWLAADGHHARGRTPDTDDAGSSAGERPAAAVRAGSIDLR